MQLKAYNRKTIKHSIFILNFSTDKVMLMRESCSVLFNLFAFGNDNGNIYIIKSYIISRKKFSAQIIVITYERTVSLI